MNGKLVGKRYQLVRTIGTGGMGSVHEAVDEVTRERVAVKLIEAAGPKHAVLVKRFAREARAAATLDTPHIVKMLDFGADEENSHPFLVLEYLDGEDVHQLIRRVGPLSPDLALRVVAQACLGLERAHEARIIHRDIKPANFFLAKVGDRDGAASGHGGRDQRVVKLLDFGIAKITRDPDEGKAETAGLTRTGSMLGSPLYMSPEQARGYKDIDRRADIWSLGVVLYQALTARTPHQDLDALGELIIAICTEEAAPVQSLAPWVPAEVAAIAHRAMRFAPEERFQSAAEMLDAIRPLLPGGWAIDEGMLQPLTQGDRERIEPRLVTQPDAPVGRGSRTNTRPDTVVTARTGEPNRMSSAPPKHDVFAPTIPSVDPPPIVHESASNGTPQRSAAPPAHFAMGPQAGPNPARAELAQLTRAPQTARSPAQGLPAPGNASSIQGLGATVASPTLPPSTAAPPRGVRGIGVVVAATIALGLAGAAALRLGRATQPIAPDPAPHAAAPPPTADSKPRTVRVVVFPGNATVEVDGVATPAYDGTVEITGLLASVHKVRARSGDTEVVRDVVVTEGGAIPPKVELPASAAIPTASAQPPPAVETKPPPGKAPSGKPTPSSALPLRPER